MTSALELQASKDDKDELPCVSGCQACRWLSSERRLECVETSSGQSPHASSDHEESSAHCTWSHPQNTRSTTLVPLTYKTLATCQPSYLYDLLQVHQPSRALRSSTQQLLHVPYNYVYWREHWWELGTFSFIFQFFKIFQFQFQLSLTVSKFSINGIFLFLFPLTWITLTSCQGSCQAWIERLYRECGRWCLEYHSTLDLGRVTRQSERPAGSPRYVPPGCDDCDKHATSE